MNEDNGIIIFYSSNVKFPNKRQFILRDVLRLFTWTNNWEYIPSCFDLSDKSLKGENNNEIKKAIAIQLVLVSTKDVIKLGNYLKELDIKVTIIDKKDK